MRSGLKVGAVLAAALTIGFFGPRAIAASASADGSLPSQGKVPKVILISLDGAKPQFIDKYIANGVLPSDSGLGLLRQNGAHAIQNITAIPSLTAVGHIEIAAGSTAVHNDIPSNTFQAVASTIGSFISGFAAPIGGYEINTPDPPSPTPDPTARPLWLALREAGQKVVAATWPGADGADIKIDDASVQAAVPTRTVDYTVPFGAFGGVSAQGFTLTSSNFAPNATVQAELAAAGHPSFSPVLVTTAPFETLFCAPTTAATCSTTNEDDPDGRGDTIEYAMKAAAIDSTNDGKVNYDTLVFFDANTGIAPGPFPLPATGPAYVMQGSSAPFFFQGSGNVVGTAYYVASLPPDLFEVRFARYGASYIPQSSPVPSVLQNVAEVNTTIGFWQPQPDFRIPERLAAGFANFSDTELEQIYEDQVTTFVNYQTKVALNALDKNPDADLVMIYIEEPDGSSHQFLLTDPLQATNSQDASTIGPKQDQAKVERYAQHIEDAYRRADQAVDAIIKKVGTLLSVPRSNIIVVSDHGFLPFNTAVSGNNLLSAALVAGGFSPTLLNTSVAIRTSGPAANIYVNLAGRQSGGTVDAATYQSLVSALSAYLREVKDPNALYNRSGKKLFRNLFVRPSSCGEPGFCTNDDVGQDSGDIFAIMGENYNFDGTQSPGVARVGDPPYDASTSVFSVPNFYGAHGYDSNLFQMSASFYAAGPDIQRGVVVPQMHNIDVAPTILRILGVEPDKTVDGAALKNILK